MLPVHLLAATSACNVVQDLLVLPGPLPHLVLVILSSWLPPSSCITPHFLWLLGYPGFLHSCILAGSSASLCCALGWMQFFILSPHRGSPFIFLLDPVQFSFSQIPIPNPLSSQQFLWSCLSIRSAPFPIFPCIHCSCCLGQDREREEAEAA